MSGKDFICCCRPENEAGRFKLIILFFQSLETFLFKEEMTLIKNIVKYNADLSKVFKNLSFMKSNPENSNVLYGVSINKCRLLYDPQACQRFAVHQITCFLSQCLKIDQKCLIIWGCERSELLLFLSNFTSVGAF